MSAIIIMIIIITMINMIRPGYATATATARTGVTRRASTATVVATTTSSDATMDRE